MRRGEQRLKENDVLQHDSGAQLLRQDLGQCLKAGEAVQHLGQGPLRAKQGVSGLCQTDRFIHSLYAQCDRYL